jgi:two-component system C4-dicarboxylate transport sensor histidine kinase DctB/two-component system sensor histidine kinase TtrS
MRKARLQPNPQQQLHRQGGPRVEEYPAMTSNITKKGGKLPGGTRAKRDRVRQLIDELSANEPAARLLRSAAGKARLAELGHLSCTIAHELRQPLFTIAMASENLRLMLDSEGSDRERMQQSVHRIAEQVQRAQTIIDQTLAYATGVDTEAGVADLGEAAANAIGFLSGLLESSQVEVKADWSLAPVFVGVSRIEMEQVFVNLLSNAVDSIKDRRLTGWRGIGKIVLTIERVGANVRCIITDNGAGLTPQMSEAVFEPFFTTKARTGTGLGLYICRHIVEKAGGVIRLVPGPMEGARIEIRLRVVPEAPASEVIAT